MTDREFKKVWDGDKSYTLVPVEESIPAPALSDTEGPHTYKGVVLAESRLAEWAAWLQKEDYLSIWEAGIDAAERAWQPNRAVAKEVRDDE